MFNCFYPETKRRNAADYAIKFLSQFILHKLNLLVFIGRTFGIHRCAFTLTAMTAFLFHLFINREFIVQYFFQYAMNHHIGITAYRRSEMCIVCKTQTVVTNIFRSINRLCHGANAQLLQYMLLWLSFYIL